ALRDRLAQALERADAAGAPTPSFAEYGKGAPVDWAAKELLRRDRQVREGLAALKSGVRPAQAWRTPFYRSHRLAAEAGVRAALWMAMASACLVLSGWPFTPPPLPIVPILLRLRAPPPTPRA